MFAPTSKTCKYFLEGNCKFDEDCKFSHIIKKVEAKICQHYLKGSCKYGKACKMIHQGLDYQIKCFISRHGQSVFNKRLELFVEKNQDARSQQAKQFQFDETLIDAGLTEIGKQQSKIARKNYMQHNIEIVFVSPLNRALETCQIIFKNRGIPIIVIPELSEILSTVCDVSNPITMKKSRFTNMDFGLFDKIGLDWQTSQISIQHHCNFDLMSAIQITKNIFDLIKKHYPQRLQRDNQCRSRVMKALQAIKEISKTRNLKNIAIIAHRRVIRQLSKTYNQKYGQGLQNAQILQLDL